MRLVVLSDAHVAPPGAPPVHDIDTNAQLETAVKRLAGLRPAPDFVVHLGDLTNEPSAEAYAEFDRLTGALPLPQFHVWGNHDDGAMLTRALSSPAIVEPVGAPAGYYLFAWGSVQVIVLNSNGPVLDGGGAVDAAQLEWLNGVLASRSGEPALVFVHHPAHAIGIAWIDRVRLQNADEVLAILSRHDGILRLFSGHVHRRTSATLGGIASETVLSTAFSLGPDHANPIVDADRGFVIVDVHGDTVGTTDVLV